MNVVSVFGRTRLSPSAAAAARRFLLSWPMVETDKVWKMLFIVKRWVMRRN